MFGRNGTQHVVWLESRGTQLVQEFGRETVWRSEPKSRLVARQTELWPQGRDCEQCCHDAACAGCLSAVPHVYGCGTRQEPPLCGLFQHGVWYQSGIENLLWRFGNVGRRLPQRGIGQQCRPLCCWFPISLRLLQAVVEHGRSASGTIRSTKL